MASVLNTLRVDRTLEDIQEEFDCNNARAVAREALCYRISSIATMVFSAVAAAGFGALTLRSFDSLAVAAIYLGATASTLILAAISYKALQCTSIIYKRAIEDVALKGSRQWINEVKAEVGSFPFFADIAE